MSNEVVERRCRRSPTGIEDCIGSATGTTGGTGGIQGPTGPEGPQGIQGPTGPEGGGNLVSETFVNPDAIQIPANSTQTIDTITVEVGIDEGLIFWVTGFADQVIPGDGPKALSLIMNSDAGPLSGAGTTVTIDDALGFSYTVNFAFMGAQIASGSPVTLTLDAIVAGGTEAISINRQIYIQVVKSASLTITP